MSTDIKPDRAPRPLRGTCTQFDDDLVEVVDRALAELHARGHAHVRAIEATAWGHLPGITPRGYGAVLARATALQLPKVAS